MLIVAYATISMGIIFGFFVIYFKKSEPLISTDYPDYTEIKIN
jgi:hypothetical protein